MSLKLEKFSDQQISLIDQRLSEWRDAVLSTSPADRATTEQIINKFYGLSGFQKPTVVWCDSPWQMVALVFVMQIINKSGREKSCKRWIKSLRNDPWFEPVWAKYDEASDSFEQLVRAPRECALLESTESKVLKNSLRWDIAEQRFEVDSEINIHLTGEAREFLEQKVQALFGDVLLGSIEAPLEAELRVRLRVLGNQLAASMNSFVHSQELSHADHSTINSFKKAKATTCDGVDGSKFTQSALKSDLLERAILQPPIERKNNFYAHIALNSNLQIDISTIIFNINWPWHDTTPLFHRLCRELLDSKVGNLEKTSKIELWCEYMKSCLAIFPLGNVCLACDRPSKLEMDQWNRLHSINGHAIAFPDKYGVYTWHGNVVESWFITNPELVSLSEIEAEQNTTRRRIMIEVFGEARYLTETGAVVEDESDFGILYRKKLSEDEDLVMVKVINSTIDPDGTWKSYYLRVPPSIRTAKEAVAWTFNMPEDLYAPVLES